jgi:glycosyltransferase involved in cell wall biosynthesis
VIRVAIVHPWFPQYRTEFFKEILHVGAEKGIHIDIFHGDPPREWLERNDAVTDAGIATPLKTKFLKTPWGALIKHDLHGARVPGGFDLVIVEQAIRNIETYSLFLANRTRVAMWGHGGSYTASPRRQWMRLAVVKRSSWFFGYTAGGVRAVVNAGYDVRSTTVVLNSIDTKALIDELEAVMKQDVVRLRKELNLEGRTALVLGGLDEAKRLPLAFAAADALAAADPAFRLVIAGDGSERQWVCDYVGSRNWAHYVGRVEGKRKAVLLRAVDIIYNPGRVGLIALDSIASGVPIISTRWDRHAPEAEYLEHLQDSVFAENDLESLIGATNSLLDDEFRRALYTARLLAKRADFSAQVMAQNFLTGIEGALRKAKGRAVLTSKFRRHPQIGRLADQ